MSPAPSLFSPTYWCCYAHVYHSISGAYTSRNLVSDASVQHQPQLAAPCYTVPRSALLGARPASERSLATGGIAGFQEGEPGKKCHLNFPYVNPHLPPAVAQKTPVAAPD